MARPTLYVETSIISYLVGWLHPRDPVVAGNQMLTREWWKDRRQDFDLFASGAVIDEALKGDAGRASERLELISHMTILSVTPAARELAEELLRKTRLPRKAELDALHIAIAAIHGMEYLLTWNCRHIANANILPDVYNVCRASGYEAPLVCTPQELIEELPNA
jgi:hypothetical protein